MFRSIRWRIAIPFVALILAIMLGLTLYLSRLIRAAHLADLRQQLLAEGRLLSDEARPMLIPGMPEADLDPLAQRWAELAGARVTIVDAAGVVLGESVADRARMDNHLGRPEVQEALAVGEGMSVRRSRSLGYGMMYVAVRADFGGRAVGVVRLALPLAQVEPQIARLRGNMLAGVVPATLLTALIALLLAARGGRRVRWRAGVDDRVERRGSNPRLSPRYAEAGELPVNSCDECAGEHG